MLIKLSDYTTTPGGRLKHCGPFSGEEWKDRVVEPAFISCRDNKQVLMIDFDNVVGVPMSFLDEAVAKMIKKYPDVVYEIICNDDPYLKADIRHCLMEPPDEP